jgi:hypothetical protein
LGPFWVDGVIALGSGRDGDQTSRAATRCSFNPPLVSGAGTPLK